MVGYALAMGYRHIDTAQMYGNESEVGRALVASGIAREEVFITTKIWPDSFRNGDLQDAAPRSLERLGLDAVDLLLLHWPNPMVPLAETIGALNEVAAQGLARHIGISNFTRALLAEAVALSERPLVANQVEYHPFLDQSALLERLREQGMALIAYSPLAQGAVFRDPSLKAIAEAHGRTPGQVALRWLIQQPGVAAIPRSSKPERAAENLAVFDFALSDQEMATISALSRPGGRLVDPGIAPAWDEA
jgi:2,5-diketo-D-gluconate reductase B